MHHDMFAVKNVSHSLQNRLNYVDQLYLKQCNYMGYLQYTLCSV